MIHTRDLIFLDTETCGTALDSPVWEVAAIKRSPLGVLNQYQFFVEHDVEAALALPARFRVDHDARYRPSEALSHADTVLALRQIFEPTLGETLGKPIVVGANVHFDTIRLAHQFLGGTELWDYHQLDLASLAWGALDGILEIDEVRTDQLARLVDVHVDHDVRHTALGDAQMAYAMFCSMLEKDWSMPETLHHVPASDLGAA